MEKTIKELEAEMKRTMPDQMRKFGKTYNAMLHVKIQTLKDVVNLIEEPIASGVDRIKWLKERIEG